MFGRNATPPPDADDQPEAASSDPRAPKGRPTPSRKEAELARRQSKKIPKDPKAAKKAARERDRAARAEARAGLMSGDERYLPPRDKGPVRSFTRDYVDGRFTGAEFFIFVAIGVILLGFLPNPQLQFWITGLFFVFTAAIAADMAILLFMLSRALRSRFPERSERKGALFYAALRALQLRRLRVPPPKVLRCGKRAYSI